MHKGRLGTVIIDCQTDSLERAAEFWGAPSKQRFCIIGARRVGFDQKASVWD